MGVCDASSPPVRRRRSHIHPSYVRLQATRNAIALAQKMQQCWNRSCRWLDTDVKLQAMIQGLIRHPMAFSVGLAPRRVLKARLGSNPPALSGSAAPSPESSQRGGTEALALLQCATNEGQPPEASSSLPSLAKQEGLPRSLLSSEIQPDRSGLSRQPERYLLFNVRCLQPLFDPRRTLGKKDIKSLLNSFKLCVHSHRKAFYLACRHSQTPSIQSVELTSWSQSFSTSANKFLSSEPI